VPGAALGVSTTDTLVGKLVLAHAQLQHLGAAQAAALEAAAAAAAPGAAPLQAPGPPAQQQQQQSNLVAARSRVSCVCWEERRRLCVDTQLHLI
jgi:hypothetical protein